MKNLLVLTVLVFFVGSCGRSLCSYEFVSAYETVRRQVNSVARLASQSDVQELKSLCSQLFGKYSGVTCWAEVSRPGQLESTEELVSIDELKHACDIAAKH